MAVVFNLLIAQINIILALIASALLYVLVLYLFKFLSAYDIKLFRDLIPWQNKKETEQKTNEI